MRANGRKYGVGGRLAILIGVAAAGVMALGAQTGAQTQVPTSVGKAPPTCKGKPATIVSTEVGTEGFGNDVVVRGTPGRDVIVGLGGEERIRGGRGNDVICGRDDGDILAGGPGKDTLLGGAGGDLLVGGNGWVDTLLGQAGRDVFIGGRKDGCYGGKGFDITAVVGGPPRSGGVCEVEKSIERSGVEIH